jgi:hypothetical protein
MIDFTPMQTADVLAHFNHCENAIDLLTDKHRSVQKARRNVIIVAGFAAGILLAAGLNIIGIVAGSVALACIVIIYNYSETLKKLGAMLTKHQLEFRESAVELDKRDAARGAMLPDPLLSPTRDEMIQAAVNVMGFFDEGNDERRSQIIDMILGACASIIGENDMQDLLAKGSDDDIRLIDHTAKLTFGALRNASDDQSWLLRECFGMLVLLCENISRPFLGEDRKIVEMAATLFAAAHMARNQ